jgi:hypothetical protein
MAATAESRTGVIGFHFSNYNIQPNPGVPEGFSVVWIGPRFDIRDVGYSFLDFHALTSNDSQTKRFILGFPIWCAVVPAVVPPVLWIRRRRKLKRSGEGFDVVTSSD